MPKNLSTVLQVIEELLTMLDYLLASSAKYLGGQETLKKDIVVDEAIKAAHSRGVSVTRSCNLVHTPKSTYDRRVSGLGKRQSADQALHTRIKALQEQHQTAMESCA